MFEIFEYQEVLSSYYTDKLPDNLKNGTTFLDESKLIRLMLGTLNIKHKLTNEIIPQFTNYSKITLQQNSRFSTKIFIETLGRSNFKKIREYLNNNRRNIPLFREMRIEFSYFIYQMHKGSCTTAYLHLYRILERISYMFPLIYVAKSNNFHGTYNKLKTFFKNTDSELSFFKLFLETLFENTHVLDTTLSITISAPHNDIQKSYFKIIKDVCSRQGIPIVDETEYSLIKFKYKDLLDFVITLRNRYFHFLTGGEKNISSIEIIEPDSFFLNINKIVANWISVIYFEMLIFRLENS